MLIEQIELVSPVGDWTVENKWLAKPSGFQVKISSRKQ